MAGSQVHMFRGRSASPPQFQNHGDAHPLHDPHDPATASPSSPTSSSHPQPPADMGKPEKQPELLDPRRSSRSTLASLNPFSSSSSRNRPADPSSAAGAGSGSKSLFGRALSRKHKTPADNNNNNNYHNHSSTGPGSQPPPPLAYAEPPLPQAPPPAYTESAAMRTASTAEDPYAFLSAFDTVFLIDDSGSMAGRSWGETQRALAAIVPICVAHDTDGVDVYFLNHKTDDPGDAAGGSAGTGFRHVRTLAAVEALFAGVRPAGATPTGTRLYKILNPYLKHYARRVRETGDETCLKPLNLIVITDGAPSDDPDQVIVNFAQKLDDLDAPPYQVGIQFFQVGNEPGAAEKLRQLDDEIANKVAGGVRDMVDTATFDAGSDDHDRVLTGEGILKVVLGSVVKRLDRVESNLRGQSASRSAF